MGNRFIPAASRRAFACAASPASSSATDVNTVLSYKLNRDFDPAQKYPGRSHIRIKRRDALIRKEDLQRVIRLALSAPGTIADADRAALHACSAAAAGVESQGGNHGEKRAIPAHPLEWPTGWKRTESYRRKSATFNKNGAALSVADGAGRVRDELAKMQIGDDDLVVSTNVPLRLDGWPRSNLGEPSDPGVAVYWSTKQGMRCMAVDRYDRVGRQPGGDRGDPRCDARDRAPRQRRDSRSRLSRIHRAAAAGAALARGAWRECARSYGGSAAGVPARAQRSASDKNHGESDPHHEVMGAWSAFCAERGISE